MAESMDEFTKVMREVKNLPKANVVRISILTTKDRQRYLGAIDAKIDATVKSKIYARIYGDDPVFYGILNTNELGIGITPQWGPGNGTAAGTIGGMVRELAANTTVGKFASDAGDIMKAMTGISGSSTGSSTMSSFSGVAMSAFTIGCTWYLPEQYTVCAHSLRVISRMAYPVQVPDDMLAGALKGAIKSIGDELSSADVKAVESAADEPSLINDAISGAGKMAVNGANFANNLLGRNLALDPIPVRCSIGHYIDIEPLVINNLNIKFSNDTFLHDSGLHLPITCSVEISFAFWMTPAPKLEFMSLLGQEMFGEGLSILQQREYYEALAANQKEKTNLHNQAQNKNHQVNMNPKNFTQYASVNDLPPLKK